MIEEPVNETEKRKNFIKYDFYNDYLPSLPKTSSDTIPIDWNETTGIISVRIGGGLFVLTGSAVLDISISSNVNITSKYVNGRLYNPGGGRRSYSFYGLGLAYVNNVGETNNLILKLNIYGGHINMFNYMIKNPDLAQI